MNDYTKTSFTVTPNDEVATDVLAALLAEIGFESFVPNDNGLEAYVPHNLYDENSLITVIESFPLEGYTITHSSEFIEGEDWNAEWEKNYFQPIVLGEECVIHSTFHTNVPKRLGSNKSNKPFGFLVEKRTQGRNLQGYQLRQRHNGTASVYA